MKMLSEIEIVPVKPKDGLVAFASFTLCGIIRCSSCLSFSQPYRQLTTSYYASTEQLQNSLSAGHGSAHLPHRRPRQEDQKEA